MNKKLNFKKYPDLKIGFSTQDFQKAVSVNTENLKEIIEYAENEGYHFIMIRDDLAELTASDCKFLAELAKKREVEIIYEIHKNPLEIGYMSVFEQGLKNILHFSGPGIIRTIVSKSEFDNDPVKKGWTRNELVTLIDLCESSSNKAGKNKIIFVVENFNEAFFGDGQTYFGFADLIANTSLTGFQFDISNPFRNTSREKANPENIEKFLRVSGNRWITTHLKTILEGEMQPVLTENPLSVEKIINIIGEQKIPWVSLELAGVTDKQQCFNNHSLSIKYLRDKEILN